jgi:hypothetical protein
MIDGLIMKPQYDDVYDSEQKCSMKKKDKYKISLL